MNELLPDDLRNSLPRLYTQGVSDPIVHLKFFFPGSAWTWFVTEGQPEGDDFMFFGYVVGFEAEWGYFALSELDGVDVKGLTIERDCYFEPSTLSACLCDLNLQ